MSEAVSGQAVFLDEVFLGEDETDSDPVGVDAAGEEPATMLLVSRDDVARGAADQALVALGEGKLAPVEVVVVSEPGMGVTAPPPPR